MVETWVNVGSVCLGSHGLQLDFCPTINDDSFCGSLDMIGRVQWMVLFHLHELSIHYV